MTSRFKSLELLRILNSLPENEVGKKPPGGNHDVDPTILLLRSWQAERMKTTYADLVADAQYRPAALFLLNDIYNPREYGVREGEVEHLRDFLSGFLPGSTTRMRQPPRGAFWAATATPIRRWARTTTGGSRSIGASMACPRHLSWMARAALSSSMWARWMPM